MNQLLLSHTFEFYTKYVNDLACGECVGSGHKLHEFMDELSEYRLLLTNFDWADWYQNSHLVDRPEYIADASLYECQLLLTAMAR